FLLPRTAICVARGKPLRAKQGSRRKSETESKITHFRTSAPKATTAGTTCRRSALAWPNGTSLCEACSPTRDCSRPRETKAAQSYKRRRRRTGEMELRVTYIPFMLYCSHGVTDASADDSAIENPAHGRRWRCGSLGIGLTVARRCGRLPFSLCAGPPMSGRYPP